MILVAVGLVAWGVSLGAVMGGRSLAGTTPISLRVLYGLALVLGWGLGNLYVARTRGALKPVRRILLPAYLLAPAGFLFLLWSTAAQEAQRAIPMAPVYASGIFAVLFLVPLSFSRTRRG